MKISGTFVKKWQLYVCFSIFVLGLTLVTAKSCRLTDRYSELSGQYDILEQQNEIIAKEAISAILTAREYIDNLREKNSELIERIELTNKQLINKNVRLIQLGNDLTTIRSDVETIPNLKKQIVNMESQLTIWKVKFTLAEKIITDKDIIIFNLKEQYDSQLKISIDFEEMYLGEKDLRRRSEVLLGITKRKLSVSRVGGTLKNVAVIMLGAVIALKIVE